MWCVCYVCRMFYQCIIMDLESVKLSINIYIAIGDYCVN